MNIETTNHISIQPTGNPFVDTGLYAMLAKAEELHPDSPPEALTPELVKEVLGDGKWLAQANRQVNSFFMVCLNSALVNPSSNKRMKHCRGELHEEDEGWKQYLSTLSKLKDELLTPSSDKQVLCESCGDRFATQLPELQRIGRDYFPLAGSLGNDAQALPAASRSPRICAFCLLAIQWLPLGAQMYNGKLACFQFTDSQLSYFAVQNTFAETISRLGVAKICDKVPIPGTGEGARQAALFLLEQMRRLQQEKKLNNLPPHVTLNIWSFSNSGADPDCELAEVPNPALSFLWEAARSHLRELQDFLKREDPKKPQTHLLNCIERGRDYNGFYPTKGKKGEEPRLASKPLYQLYQTQVLGRTVQALSAAERLAQAVYNELTTGEAKEQKKKQKKLDALLKESPRRTKDQAVRTELKRLCADLAELGQFTLEDYVCLFPTTTLNQADKLTASGLERFWREPGRAIKASHDGWDVFWFYLHHAAKSSNNTEGFTPQMISHTATGGHLAMFTNPKIKSFARDVFALYLAEKGGKDQQRGLDWIKKNILDKFRRNEITTGTLRRWFCLLAESKPDYQNEDWDALCRDEQGREVTGELRFQFRLEIANLYRAATSNQN